MTTNATRWSIAGHRSAVEILARAIRTGQVGHAYLISGPEGIGRRTLATTFARALVCQALPEDRPCGICSACRRVERGIHPDVSVVSLANQAEAGGREARTTRISIETIRELRASIALRPLEAPWRVALLYDVDLFSLNAYDALLKTLEEPPSFVVLVLVATEVEAVPETIRSRCLPLPLEPLARGEVAAVLMERGVDPAEAATIASVTRGRVGQAIALAGDAAALAARRESIAAGLAMIEDPLVALGAVRRLADLFRRGQRAAVEAELDRLLGLWRDLLLVASGCPEHVVNADVAAHLGELAGRWPLTEIERGLRATYDALTDLSLNVQPRLALDRMVTQWPGRG